MKDDKLAPCPCGKTPTAIGVYELGNMKWALAVPNCCGDWMVEFCTDYKKPDSEECKAFAVEAWNEAARASK